MAGRSLITFLILAIGSTVAAQEFESETAASPWQMQKAGTTASLRGLHVVNDSVVWASGTGGTVLRTSDGGETWKIMTPPEAEELDFRDIHAFDDQRAVIINAGAPARIYRTTDAGRTWQLVFEHPNEEAFFDALSFWDSRHGVVMSDPIDDRVLLIGTQDGGATWTQWDPELRPKVIPGEAGFAASGTNMVIRRDGTCLIALGGAKENESFPNSRILMSSDQGQTWSASQAPLPRNPSSGIFSLAFANDLIGVAVGGDYLSPDKNKGNVAVTIDGGLTWKVPSGHKPRGYRSGVAANRSGKLLYFVAVGPTGTDWSTNNGYHWEPLSDDSFHAVQFSPSGKTGWASGAEGRIGKWMPK